MAKRKWIQKAVKREGRIQRLIRGWNKMSKSEKLAAINRKLKALEGKKGEKAKSLRSALILAKRFVGGEFGKKKRSRKKK